MPVRRDIDGVPIMTAAALPLMSLRQFWDWWSGELAAVFRVPLTAVGTSRPSVTIFPQQSQVTAERVADGIGQRFVDECALDDLSDASWDRLREIVDDAAVRVVLSEPDTMAVRIALPRAARSRLRPAIALHLSEHLPIEPELAVWGIVEQRAAGADILVELIVARAAQVEDINRAFAEHGLLTPQIAGRIGEREVMFSRGERPALKASERRPLLLAAVLVAIAPVLTLVGAELLIAQNEAAIARLEAELAPKREAARLAREREQLRAGLATLPALPLSTLLDDVAANLPQSAHLQSAQRQGRSVTLEIEAADPDTVRDGFSAGEVTAKLREVDQSRSPTGQATIRYEAVL